MTTKSTLARAGGLVGALLIACLPSLVIAATIEPLSATSGTIATEQLSEPRALTSPEVVTVVDWLERHRSGWGINFATGPAPTILISLDTAERKEALILALWAGPKYPGWQQSVIVESPAGTPLGIQNFSAEELAPILAITHR